MILLSKLIKSTYIKQLESEEKRIYLKSISPAIAEAEEPKSVISAEEKSYGTPSVHYNEQKGMQEQKERIAQEALQLEKQKQAWIEEKKQQQLQVEEIIEIRANQAEEEGFNQGYAKAVDEVRQEYSSLIKQAQETINIAKVDYLKKIEESEAVVLELSLSIAQKVIGKTLSVNDSSWVELLKKAVSEVREHEEVKIYVHPAWYEVTLFHKRELQDIALHTRDLLIYPDEHLQENGCVIETPYGQMDASLDSQLLEMKKSLFEKLREGTASEY